MNLVQGVFKRHPRQAAAGFSGRNFLPHLHRAPAHRPDLLQEGCRYRNLGPQPRESAAKWPALVLRRLLAHRAFCCVLAAEALSGEHARAKRVKVDGDLSHQQAWWLRAGQLLFRESVSVNPV